MRTTSLPPLEREKEKDSKGERVSERAEQQTSAGGAALQTGGAAEVVRADRDHISSIFLQRALKKK